MSILKPFLNVPISPQITNSLHSKCWFSDPVIFQGTCDMTLDLEGVHICHIVIFTLSRWLFIYLFVYFFNSPAFPFRLSVFLHTLLFSHYNTEPPTFCSTTFSDLCFSILATIHISLPLFLIYCFSILATIHISQFLYSLHSLSRFWHLFDWNSNSGGGGGMGVHA